MGHGKHILYLEDEHSSIVLFKNALKVASSEMVFSYAYNGKEGLAFLENEEANLPNLILTDLNMPRMDGFEFLQKIKSDKRFRHIPVLVFSTSEKKSDIEKAYELQASGYIVKPFGFDAFVDYIKRISDFCSINSFPGDFPH